MQTSLEAGKNGTRGASDGIGDKQSAQGEWSTIVVSKRRETMGGIVVLLQIRATVNRG